MRAHLLAAASMVLFAAGCSDSAARDQSFVHTPEDIVVCTGWHALCSASPDCRTTGDTATCDCMRGSETHIVTSTIQDEQVKRATLANCTSERPCAVDEAPVCAATRDGTYTVDGLAYDWVSTYSYRGWCSILEQGFVPCDPSAPGCVVPAV